MDLTRKFRIWAYVIVAVAIAVFTNSISAIWAEQDNRFSWWLLAVVVLAPFVFITFGLVTEKVGVAVAAGTIDSLLTISTVLVGLIFFNEWDELSLWQYIGLVSVLLGVVLLQFEHREQEGPPLIPSVHS